MNRSRVVVVGAGIGGLVAALKLSLEGIEVTVFEKALQPGGKMREVAVAGENIDAGPTVLTMRWIFDEIFEAAGTTLDDHLALRPLEVLARHAWTNGAQLDLYADVERNADAIGTLAGLREARGYLRFARRAEQIYETLAGPFMGRSCQGPLALVQAVGFGKLHELWRIAPFTSMHRALRQYFEDPRLLQLFGRYATYCGSSPYLAPATLMLIAHVERMGVSSVEGGMHGLARALAALGAAHGVRFYYGSQVTAINTSNGRVEGVTLQSGERIQSDAVVLNADAAALGQGLFGHHDLAPATHVAPGERSLSAMTWVTTARTSGFTLLRHNVFFSDDYAREFEQLFVQGRTPDRPTVYVCAQDRGDPDDPKPDRAERLLCLINAPANGDAKIHPPLEFEQCQDAIYRLLDSYGLYTSGSPMESVATGPKEFNRLFPGTGGALYGAASHGWRASFRRPGARTRVPGLYLAGGSTHPGAGVPMAAISGTIAAASLLRDRASIAKSHQTGTRGGTSTPSATMGSTRSP